MEVTFERCVSTADSEGRALQPEELAVAIIMIANTYTVMCQELLNSFTYINLLNLYSIL